MIKKQEFYEGAALYLLLRTNKVERVAYAHPFFILNEKLAVLLKFSTAKDSPWNFVFTPAELVELQERLGFFSYSVGLICGSDGVVSLSQKQFFELVGQPDGRVRVGCYRKHDQHYQVNGPLGTLPKRITRQAWLRLIDNMDGT